MLATISNSRNTYRPFPFDYSLSATARGWGSGWPNCPSWDKLATVVCDRSNAKATVRKELSVLVDAIMNSVERDGCMFRKEDTGGFNCRDIKDSKGGSTGKPSNHSWGLAVDGNWNENPNTYDTSHIVTTYPDWVVARFNRYGFAWGGMYADSMHWEFMGTPAQAAQQRDLALKELADTEQAEEIVEVSRMAAFFFALQDDAKDDAESSVYLSADVPMLLSLNTEAARELRAALKDPSHVALLRDPAFSRVISAGAAFKH